MVVFVRATQVFEVLGPDIEDGVRIGCDRLINSQSCSLTTLLGCELKSVLMSLFESQVKPLQPPSLLICCTEVQAFPKFGSTSDLLFVQGTIWWAAFCIPSIPCCFLQRCEACKGLVFVPLLSTL